MIVVVNECVRERASTSVWMLGTTLTRTRLQEPSRDIDDSLDALQMRNTLSSWRETNAIPEDMDDMMMHRKDLRFYMAYLHSRRGVILFSINVVLLVIFYMWLLYGLVVELAGLQEMVAPLMLMQSIALVVFCVLHSMAVLGWKCALVFFAITVVVSTVVEMVGVHTGVIFGQYQYTSLIGVKVLDVPLEVPFSWFMMLYPSFCVADLIIEGQAHSRRPKSRWLSLITISTCTAFVVTGWDLAADPLGSTDSGIWVWTHGTQEARNAHR